MRVYALATAALAALALASAPASAATFRPEVLQKACSDMTYTQVVQKLAGLVEEYEFSTDPAMAEQEAVGLLCPAQANESVQKATNLVIPLGSLLGQNQQTNRKRRPPPPYHAGNQQLRPPHVPPPPARGYGAHRSGSAVASAGSGYGYGRQESYGRERSVHSERHQQSFQSKATNYCPTKAEFDAQFGAPPSHNKRGVAYISCDWEDQLPNKPCGGYHCRTR